MATQAQIDEAKRLLQARRAKEILASRRKEQEPEEELGTPWEAAGRSALQGGRNVLQGLSAGTADEIESAIGSTFSDETYDEYMADL